MKYTVFKIAVWLLFLPLCSTLCPREHINDSIWDATESSNDEKTSTPICLDDRWLPVTRKCKQNDWKPIANETNCAHKQNDDWYDTFCPHDYKRVPNTKLCILISVPQNWSEICLQSTEFDPSNYNNNSNVQNVLQEDGKGAYWLPIRRDNHLEHVKYKIVTRYNFKFDELLISGPIHGNCITLEYSMSKKWRFSLSNCEKHFSMVCLIDIDKYYEFSQHHCLDNYVTTYNPLYQNQCYQLQNFSDSLQPPVIDDRGKQFIIDKLIEKENKTEAYIHIDAGGKRFTNWNSNFSKPDPSVLNFTTLKNKRWHLITEKQLIRYSIDTKFIRSADTGITDPGFTIIFNEANYTISKRGTSQNNFLEHSCFLNDEPKLNDTVGLESDIGRHLYWCEGFKVITLKFIKSQLFEVWSNETSQYEIFVAILEKDCVKCDFVYEIRLLQKDNKWNEFSKQIPTLKDGKVQFRKIIEIDVKSQKTKFSVHLLVKKRLVPLKTLYEIIMYQVNGTLHKMSYNLIDLRFIDICIGGRDKYFNFADAKIGETRENRYCKQPNGEFPSLNCVGNITVGAYWENDHILKHLKCDYLPLLEEVNRTVSSHDPKEVVNLLESTSQIFNNIASIKYNNDILRELLNTNNKTLFDGNRELSPAKQPFGTLVKFYDNVLHKNDLNDTESQAKTNVSSEFLNIFKRIIETYLQSEAAEKDLSKDGFYIIHERIIILLVTIPSESNISGISIHKIRLRRKEENFKGFTIKKLTSNNTPNQIIDRRLEAGINIPQFVIGNFSKQFLNKTNIRIVLSVFYKDSWFTKNAHNGSIGVITSKSKITGVFLPEYLDNELPDGIFSVLKTLRNRRIINNGSCTNWQMDNYKHGWNESFLAPNKLGRNLINCPIKYASFSGYVQLIGNDQLIDCDINLHGNIIKWITVIMSVLSAIGILNIFVAALKIPSFRTHETTPLILFLAFANGLQIAIFILFVELEIVNGNEMNEELCLATGATLHYLTLVGFFVSLFATDHLIRTYIMGSDNLVATTFKIKAVLFGWILPLIVVGTSLMVDIIFEIELYLPIDVFNDYSSVCYPVDELLILSIHIPIALIVTLHLIIFFWVVIKTNQNPDSLITNVSRLKEKCQMYVFMFSILSISWLFAVVAYYVDNCWLHIIFSYLFVITAPSQGLQIFLICIVFNKNVQHFFKRLAYNRKL